MRHGDTLWTQNKEVFLFILLLTTIEFSIYYTIWRNRYIISRCRTNRQLRILWFRCTTQTEKKDSQLIPKCQPADRKWLHFYTNPSRQPSCFLIPSTDTHAWDRVFWTIEPVFFSEIDDKRHIGRSSTPNSPDWVIGTNNVCPIINSEHFQPPFYYYISRTMMCGTFCARK